MKKLLLLCSALLTFCAYGAPTPIKIIVLNGTDNPLHLEIVDGAGQHFRFSNLAPEEKKNSWQLLLAAPDKKNFYVKQFEVNGKELVATADLADFNSFFNKYQAKRKERSNAVKIIENASGRGYDLEIGFAKITERNTIIFYPLSAE